MDAPEREVIEELDIPSFPMKVVDRIGIRECLARALDRINPAGSRAIHVSFDIDALDHTEAPATGTSGKFLKETRLYKVPICRICLKGNYFLCKITWNLEQAKITLGILAH